MKTTSATGSDAHGPGPCAAFTLVELTIVVFILGVVTAVCVPAFSRSYRSALFRQTVRAAATACQLARLQAVLQQRPAALHADLDRQQIWVGQAAAAAPASSTNSATATEPGAGQVLQVIEIKAPVRITSAQRAGEAVLVEGQLAVTFQPNGTAEPVTIVFSSGERRETLALMLDPVTGRATITEVRP